MNSVIKRVLKGEWASLQDDIEKMAANKVRDRVEDKKIEILAGLNDVSVEKQKELMDVSTTEES